MRLYVTSRGRTGVSFGCLGSLVFCAVYVLMAAGVVAGLLALGVIRVLAWIGAAVFAEAVQALDHHHRDRSRWWWKNPYGGTA